MARPDPFTRKPFAKKENGAFSVELVMVLPALMMFLVFITDMVTRLTIHGQIQQLSYSAVSLIKERTQLYNKSQDLTEAEVGELYALITQSLNRTQTGFKQSALGIRIEQVGFTNKDLKKPFLNDFSNGISCQPDQPLDHNNVLFIATRKAKPIPLYRVSLCYKVENLFSRFGSEKHAKLQASSLMIGR